MRPSEKCGRIPELIDKIVSYLDHPTQLACLRVNSSWNKAAAPLAALSSIGLLLWPFSHHAQNLRQSKELQEALRRNLGHIRVLSLFNVAVLDIISDADGLVNLKTLYYLGSESSAVEATNFLTIIKKNPCLQQIYLFTSPFQGSDYYSNRFEGAKFYYDHDDNPNMWMEGLAAALQPLALTKLYLECWLELEFADFKLILRAILKSSLKSLKMKLDFRDDYIRDGLQTWFGSGDSSNAQDELEPMALGLERLHLDLVVRGAPDGKLANILYRPLVFPILRKSPNLKRLFVSALDQRHVPELKAILQESCPLIEELEFTPNHRGPDERACTDLVLACPRLRKIESHCGSPWNLTELAPGILRHPDVCLRLDELQLNLKHHEKSSGWIQQLLCSLPNLRIFRQQLEAEEYAHLNICDLVQSRWVCTRLEQLHFVIGSISRRSEEEEAETVEQRTCKVRQVYEQLGALTQLKNLGIRYLALEESPVQFDMTFKTGLKAMEPCLSSLKDLDIVRVEDIQIGIEELHWMVDLGIERESILLFSEGEAGFNSEDFDDYEDEEDDENEHPVDDAEDEDGDE
ncbi:hypothetical protein BGZ72_001391 [Mortierella alpina]|nr:hypothetical protein BGZ72_001391 [Mortierella alpina]